MRPRLRPDIQAATENGSVRLRLLLQPDHHHHPFLSEIFAQGIGVILVAAQLRPQSPGWVDLELQGSASQIQAAVAILSQRGADVQWKSPQAIDSWHY